MRNQGYGYSQQTVDAITKERDALRAENKRLRTAMTVFTNAELYGYKTAKVARAALEGTP